MSLFDPDSPPGERPATSILPRLTPESLSHAAQSCRACERREDATQVVVGAWERPSQSGRPRLMLVGPPPGDREEAPRAAALVSDLPAVVRWLDERGGPGHAGLLPREA
jgi:hypothetical protein